MHRRLPSRNRRYIPAQTLAPVPSQPQKEEIKKNIIELSNIPLPNEVEYPDEKKPVQRGNPFSNIFNKIHIDDLILLGLVFLFIDEGRHEAEDDFLIVILLYLFLAGRN